jgi:hypothetical protein
MHFVYSRGFNPVIRHCFWLSVTLVSHSCEMREEYTRLIKGRTAHQNPLISPFIELWGCVSKSNIVIMQRSQSIILRAITNAPRYVTNHILHTDFNIPYVSDVIHERINKHHNNLEAQPNPLSEPPLQPVNTRRLKSCWPLDLQGDIAGWIPYHVIAIRGTVAYWYNHHISLQTVLFLSANIKNDAKNSPFITVLKSLQLKYKTVNTQEGSTFHK